MKLFKQLWFALFVIALAAAAAVSASEAEVNCDEICASQVAEATRAAQQEKAELEGQVAPLKAALEQAKEASVTAASEVTAVKSQLASIEGQVAAAKAEVGAVQAAAAEKEAASAAKILELEAEVAAANKKLEEYESARYFINKDLIKADAMGLLKKYGLVKDKAPEEDL